MTKFADSSLFRTAAIAEVTWGTTPASPAFAVLRRRTGNIAIVKGTEVADEVNLHRNIIEVVQTARDARAQYGGYLSYGLLDSPYLESALQSVWSTNVMPVGSTRKSMTVEDTVDLRGSSLYRRMTGAEVDKLSINIPARGPITWDMTLVGKDIAIDTAIISGATYVAANTNQIEHGAKFSGLALHGLSPVPRVRSIQLQIDNGLSVNDGLGDLNTDEFTGGPCMITGTIECLISSNTALQKVLDHATGQLQFTVGDVTNKKYTFNLPTIRFLEGVEQIGGSRSKPILSIPFQAEGTSAAPGLTITRAVA